MLSIKSKAIKAGPKIVALLRRGLGPTSSIIGEKLKSTKVYIQKNRKVANYASVPLVMEVETWGIAWLVEVESLKEIDNGQCWFKLGFR
ncbi:hypothetical protein [Clostridium senegalense]|uniref:hypothetical protein n=1 Tax=Clostridium senegalense TaxID=1465809 RepID=UPI000289A294|nr:hypothetical protein [Clostridium senegalense]